MSKFLSEEPVMRTVRKQDQMYPIIWTWFQKNWFWSSAWSVCDIAAQTPAATHFTGHWALWCTPTLPSSTTSMIEQPCTLQEDNTCLKQSALQKGKLKAIQELQIVHLISVDIHHETEAADCLYLFIMREKHPSGNTL